MQVGLTPIWGVEYDSDIARAAERNTNAKMIVARAQDVDYSRLESPSWLHMSPPCINASVAKSGAGEAEADRELAKACARAIRDLRPPFISLENVWNYRTFDSFQIICNQLALSGYHFRFWHLNAANYGVPQTRKRLFLVASSESVPVKPRPTHTAKVQHGLFESLPQWVGWYEAIEDLIPTLPESRFADWQLKRLPADFDSFMHPYVTADGTTPPRLSVEPSFGINATVSKNMPRAFIAHPNADNDWFLTREAGEPVFTIKANNNGIPKAFIAAVQGEASDFRDEAEPNPTITTAHGASKYRAFLIDRINYSAAQVQNINEPAFTITVYSPKHQGPQAWLSQGRVVSMTPRALARFQAIPDEYLLPDNNGLACRIIGNAVPPLMMRRIIEANVRACFEKAA